MAYYSLIRIFAFPLVGFLLFSCSSGTGRMEVAEIQAEEVMELPLSASTEEAATGFASSSSARVNAADTVRRFVRTARLSFETRDVIRVTYAIEDIITGYGGFVENTRLWSEIRRTSSVRVSRDSTLESTFYDRYNTMTLRIPFRRLDTALKEIAAWAGFMDYRSVEATDVQLSILRNNLAHRRATRLEKRMESAIDNKGERLDRIAAAEERAATVQELADEAMLANMELKDKIEFSVITVEMHQEEAAVRRVMKANEDNIAEYRPSFGIRLTDALKYGWESFTAFVIFMANLWTLWLIAAGAFAGIRYYRRRKKDRHVGSPADGQEK